MADRTAAASSFGRNGLRSKGADSTAFFEGFGIGKAADEKDSDSRIVSARRQ
jgi:hypothetical protein